MNSSPEPTSYSASSTTASSSTASQNLPEATVDLTNSSDTTTQTSQIPRPDHPYKPQESESSISLSEILQGVGISLPQFLVQLKMHDSDLKQFTTKLEKRALSRLEFKRAKGSVGELLKILEEDKGVTRPPPITTVSPYESTKQTFRRLSYGFTENRSENITLQINSSSSTTNIPMTIKILPTEQPTSPSTTNKTQVPKRFGFKPSSTIKKDGVMHRPVYVEFTSSSPTEKTIEISTVNVVSGKTNKTDDETVKEESLIYRPYQPVNSWRERMHNNMGVSNRLGTTTKRPTVRPNYSYNGENSDIADLIKTQDISNIDSPKEMVRIDVVALATDTNKNRFEYGTLNTDTNVIGLVEGTPLGGNYNHPRYDKDPNSLNIATRSAIMAAGVLGGIALAVFLTILVFVMYRNHVGRRRRRLRVPFPLSVASDDSSTSTPPLYSTRTRSGIGTRSSAQTDFWGTLKRKFDPYSLSSTSASYY